MPNREMLENRKHSTAYIPYSFYECRIPEFYLNVPMHWHDEFEINRILRGRGEFICGDAKLTAGEGDLLVLPPDTLHAAYPCDGSALIYQAVVFSPVMLGTNSNDRCTIEYIRPMIKGSIRPEPLICPASANYVELKASADRVFSYSGLPEPGDAAEAGKDTFHTPSPREDLLLKGELLHFFGLLDCESAEGVNADGNGRTRDTVSYTEMIRPALEFMVENYRENISVDELAELVHLSKSYFMSCFKKAAGTGAIEYLTQLRINAACRMLTDTVLPVSDIAYSCGYCNLSNFNRQFRKLAGCSPKEYRRSRD